MYLATISEKHQGKIKLHKLIKVNKQNQSDRLSPIQMLQTTLFSPPTNFQEICANYDHNKNNHLIMVQNNIEI